ncbi:MAG: hypothetical protein J6K61_05855 [Clostridia bacterium]|nr:hypothetical protein [Clostridia bacterium]
MMEQTKTIQVLKSQWDNTVLTYLLQESEAHSSPLAKELYEGECKEGKKLYHISVSLQRGDVKREASIPALTDKKDFAEAFLQFLCRHRVTPLSLYDIYVDCLTP